MGIENDVPKQFLGRGNRASVCHWDLTVKFLTKEQCKLVIKELLEFDCDIDFEYYSDNDEYYISIPDMSWASNLIQVAEILKKYDHCID